MKLIFTIFSLLWAFCAFCMEIQVNGDFEKCSLHKNEVGLWPDNWHRSKGSQKALIEVYENAKGTHSGKYALSLECEPGERAYIFHHPLIRVGSGDTPDVAVWMKGVGRVVTGFVVYGYTDDPKKFVHISSVSSKPFQTGGKWYKNTFTFQMKSREKNGKTYDKFLLMPFIDLRGEGSVVIDAYSINVRDKKGE